MICLAAKASQWCPNAKLVFFTPDIDVFVLAILYDKGCQFQWTNCSKLRCLCCCNNLPCTELCLCDTDGESTLMMKTITITVMMLMMISSNLFMSLNLLVDIAIMSLSVLIDFSIICQMSNFFGIIFGFHGCKNIREILILLVVILKLMTMKASVLM